MHFPAFIRRFPAFALCFAACLRLLMIPASAQVYEKMFSFTDARAAEAAVPSSTGSYPDGELVLGNDGNFYGTTIDNGFVNYGTVFRVTPAGVITTLAQFTGVTGAKKGNRPIGVTFGSDGNLYGTTYSGGQDDGMSGYGTIFRLTPSGAFTTLLSFSGGPIGGYQPDIPLTQGDDGFLYGSASNGLFRITPSGAYSEFSQGVGSFIPPPIGGRLIKADDGYFYGVSQFAGENGAGAVFRFLPNPSVSNIEMETLASITGGLRAGLVQGNDGNFYGSTGFGGAFNAGTIFRLTPAGVLTTLVEFTGNGVQNKGEVPGSALVQAGDGNFYGRTNFGGTSGFGTIFRMTPAGTLTTLHEFTALSTPNYFSTGLTLGDDGQLYGVHYTGGVRGKGSIFRISLDGTYTTISEFTGGEQTFHTGSAPSSPLVESPDGSFFGTTSAGGGQGFGTVYRLTASGELTNLVEFTGAGGARPGSQPRSLVRASDGFFYGTTAYGGTEESGGTVFRVSSSGAFATLAGFGKINNQPQYPSSLAEGDDGNFYGTISGVGANGLGSIIRMTPTGTLTTLIEFTGVSGATLGAYPNSLVKDSDGSFIGTTERGGANDCGTIFRLLPNGTLTTLVEFTDNGATNKGRQPLEKLVKLSDGNFYGTTSRGGTSDTGTVFRMTPAGVLTTLNQLGTYHGVVGGDDGNIYGVTYGAFGAPLYQLFRVTPSGTMTVLSAFSEQPAGSLIKAADGTFYFPSYDENAGAISRLIPLGAPRMYGLKTATLATTSAAIATAINACGSTSAIFLEYGTDGVTFPNSVALPNLNGYQTRKTTTTLGGLAAGVTYHVRVRATNSAGATLSAVQAFTTLTAPLAVVAPPTELTQTSARFNATVNARNYAATTVFEWGTDGNNFPNTVAAVPGTVSGNAPIAVSAAVAGLVKGTPYFYRVRATNAGGVAVSGTQSFTTLTEPLATLGASFALTTTSVRVNGTVRARNSDAQVFFDYGTDGVNFPNSVGATPGLVTGDAVTAVSADLTNLAQGVTYHVRVRAVSAGGTGFSGTGTLQVAVLSGFLQQAPVAVGLEERSGFLFVNLIPSGIGAGWRFVGEQSWRASGVPVGSLTTGDREIEYRPAAGYDQPLRETVSIISGGEATFIEREYYEVAEPGGTGGMIVLLRPEALTLPALPVEQRAQWRLLGEDETAWRESGATLDGLRPGAYLVEAKPLAGRATPPNLSVTVTEGVTATAATTYFLADAVTGTAASLLPFETVTGSPNLPYQYVGQLRSDAGAGSGFVVRARVVATAAHVVFDDATLSAATGQQWLFQRDRVNHEPKPQLPRGAYLFAGYSAQRTTENTPGTSSPASQTLDAAVVYFLEDAGRGSFAGYLASDATPNEWLASSALKTLVGYPITGISASAQGRMHATPPMNVAFTHSFGRTYTTANIRSSGGASGGPLCVQFEGGAYYPAAIFLGGSGQTVVRVIDSDLIEMFNRGEISGNGGDNNGTGGITHTSTPLSGSGTAGASLKVTLSNGSGKWRIGTTGTLQNNNVTLNSLTPGARTLNFTAVAGFLQPPAYSVTLTSGQLTTITVPYNGITGQPPNRTVSAFSNAVFSVTVSGTPTGYQWRRNGVNIAGATARTYTRTNVSNSSEGSYTCVVTWDNGTQTSAAGTLTVLPVAQAIIFDAIPDQPYGAPPVALAATATGGLPVTFTVVSGPAVLLDDALSLTGIGTITVRASQDGDGDYQSAPDVERTFSALNLTPATWLTQTFTPTEQANPAIAGLLADPDGDGVKNIFEFAFNLNPKATSLETLQPGTGTSGLPSVARNGGGSLTIEFIRRRAAAAPGIIYAAEFASSPAGPWTAATVETATIIDATFERVAVIDPAPAPNRFTRVRVSTAP